jgi:hypothetical protein
MLYLGFVSFVIPYAFASQRCNWRTDDGDPHYTPGH